MAGDGEDGRMYVLLLFITVFMRLAFIRQRSRFQQRLRLLTIRSRMRRTDACSLQLRRKFRKRKIAWVLERPQFWFEHMVLSHYENNIWREHFRISRQTFRFVCDLVRPHLARQDTNMRKAIPVEKRVAVALWRLATGNSYRSTGLVFGVGRCTAMNLKDEFCSALLMSANDFIKFPKGEAETKRAIQAFQEISCFPQVVGAIDRSHIPIIAPKIDPNDYYNRKQFHSIVLQGVADADGRFIHVSTGYAGSIHDARVLRMSSLVNEVEDRTILVSPVIRTGTGEEIRPLLVADPAYKLTNWCMKPYPETRAITPSQRNFNKALSRARVVIEQAFGKLKGRWRCLLVKLDESVDKIPLTIITCCILHNICIEVRDDVEVDPEDDDPDDLPPLPGHMNREGSRLRNKIKEAFFSY
ncbi:hypothetical protein ABFA07_021040 [Porites harrisoni]